MGEYVILVCKIILILMVVGFTVFNLRALKGKTKNKWLLTQIGLGVVLLFALLYKLYYVLVILGYVG